MKFKSRNLRELAEMVIGDAEHFPYRSSSYITRFFEECDLDFVHDGSTRWHWTASRLEELLEGPQPTPNALPEGFVRVLRVLMDPADAVESDPGRAKALESLNKPLAREGYEAFFGDDGILYIKHIRTNTITAQPNPHRPFTAAELKSRVLLSAYLESCSEDELIEKVLVPLFRQLGYHRVSPAGHKDKSLEYGKDVWMRYCLPTQHVLYFGLQAKKGGSSWNRVGRFLSSYSSGSMQVSTLSRR